jgi:hypothetical protein
MMLADTLTALGRTQEAKATYLSALGIARTMESSVAAEWVPQVQQKLAHI